MLSWNFNIKLMAWQLSEQYACLVPLHWSSTSMHTINYRLKTTLVLFIVRNCFCWWNYITKLFEIRKIARVSVNLCINLDKGPYENLFFNMPILTDNCKEIWRDRCAIYVTLTIYVTLRHWLIQIWATLHLASGKYKRILSRFV